MKLLLSLLLSISFVLPSYAVDCSQNVSRIKANVPSPCDAWIVSEPTMQELTKNKDELDKQRKVHNQLLTLRDLDSIEISYYKIKVDSIQLALDKSESQKYWTGIGAFALGVIVTGFAAKVAIEATRK